MRKSNDRNSGRGKGRSSSFSKGKGDRKGFSSKRSSGGYKRNEDEGSDRKSGRSTFVKSDNYKKDEGYTKKKYKDDDSSSDRKSSYRKDDSGDGRKKYGDRSEGGYKKKSYGDDRKSSYRKDDSGDGRKKYGDRSEGGYKKKSYGDDRKSEGGYERKKYGDRSGSSRSEGGFKKKSFGDDRKSSYRKDDNGDGRKKYGDRSGSSRSEGGYKKKSFGDDRKSSFKKDDSGYERKKFGDRSSNSKREGGFEKKKYGDRSEGGYKKKPFGDSSEKRPFKREGGYEKKEGFSKRGGFKPREEEEKDARKDDFKYDRFSGSKDGSVKRFKEKEFEEDEILDLDAHEDEIKTFKKNKSDYEKRQLRPGKDAKKADDGLIRLNKFIANTGVCSRREADDLITAGAVKVNGKVVTELGTKIRPDDKVQYGDQTIKTEKTVYLLLNKPKDYITTMDDPQGRKTVMSLIRGACKERVYPVGRLDRNTTGLLLFTNDGELTKRLTHPKFLVSKMYHAQLDKNMKHEDFEKMKNGLELEDGFIKPDRMEYVADGSDKKQIGLEIHSGRNRIVRRMFEHLGYDVVKLDRVTYAGITKKDLPRGKWRFLEAKEVGFLRML